MVWQEILIIAAGFTALAISARFAIRSLIRVSRHYEVPEFVISFLLVGVVAILPELSIGINAALQGTPNFGLGIVFGSNIADLTLIIGLVAIAANGFRVHSYTLRNSRFLLLAVLLPVLLLWDGGISRLDGFILLAGFAWYVFGMLSDRGSWPHSHSMKEEANVPAELIVLAASLAALFVSGDIILGAATSISTMLMLPLFFVGLLAAVGTCLPELNFEIQAAKKRH